MRRLIGRALSCHQNKAGEFIVRVATLNGNVYQVSLDTGDNAEPASLAIGFPLCALILFSGHYRGTNGFKALGFEVIPKEFAA